jgi:hypothetical protein
LFTSKTLLKDSPLHRYCGVLGISVDTKVLKSKIIPKNNVSLPCRELGMVWEGIRYRYGYEEVNGQPVQRLQN